MLGASILSHFLGAARRFLPANQGNIAVIFAIAVVPVISFVGAAIDYTRANSARSAMQAALDSTALMLSKDLSEGVITAAQVNAKAATYFAGLYTNPDAKSNATVTAVYTANSSLGSQVVVTGSGSVTTQFMKVAGFPNMNIGTTSTAAWGNTRMRVALVLDNTGSMDDNGKMEAMQKAAKEMVDTLAGYNKVNGDVYISLIPFAKDVNVGTSNVNASWLNWSEWEAEPAYLDQNGYPSNWGTTVAGSNCPFTDNNHGFTCMDRPATLPGAQSASRIPSSGTYYGYICPSMDSGRKISGKTNIYYNGCYTTVTGSSATCGTNTSCTCSGSGSSKVCHLWRGDGTAATAAAAPAHSTWTGCVNDRDQSYDTTNTVPGSGSATPSTQFYAEQWSGCLPANVAAMSNQFQTIKDQITAMSPSGNTNQAVGLAWGWLSLNTASAPIKAPAKDSNFVYKDYIVLLSDGLNTQNRWSTSQSAIDDRQTIMCQNIKKDTVSNPIVFTIQVNIGNKDAKSQVLENCATNGNFQMITATSQTAEAFQNVLNQISKLRVAR